MAALAALRGIDGFVSGQGRALAPDPAASLSVSSLASASSAGNGLRPHVLLFDCDGVIIETKELHRLACNATFSEFDLYKDLVVEKASARPGVLELMDEALADKHVLVGVCSASTKEAVTKVLDVTLGEDRRRRLDE